MNRPESTRTLRLPRLTLNESRARTLVARHGQELPLQLGTARWSVSLRMLPLGEAALLRSGAWILQIEWAGARFVLRLPAAGLTRIVEASVGEPGFELTGLPPELAADALEQAWSQLAGALVLLQRGKPRLQRAAFDDPNAPELQHRMLLSLACAGHGETFRAELATDPLGLMLAAGALAARPARGQAAAAPLHCRIEIGRTRLKAALLASLRPHDVVLFDEPAFSTDADGGHRLWLRTGDAAGLLVRLAGTRIEVIEAWKKLTMKPAPDRIADPVRKTLRDPAGGTGRAPADDPAGDPASDPTSAADDSPTLAFDSVPVLLSFDLGELVVPLAELQQLVPGQAFDLGRPLAAAVRVRANGALVGRGELVEIDGRLGVALTRIGNDEL